ncbi:FAD-binding and (Fe-S)-binding domain-containing protein [Egicoccus sp. AB-alg6-2]|uniref:FAD-binding and (Fe-S)-binding domain-containing protein n=1 Tax=Egicoccus sp. AB-alg6-2 TaxID=3242692 RepID=UPI00359CFF23
MLDERARIGEQRRDLAADLGEALDGEVRFDAYTRHLYATDASMYAIEPLGVAYPRHADDVAAAVSVAARHGVPVLPRGAGTSHCGQTVGAAVVLDFSRHLHGLEVDAETATARVQPGAVQDELNRAAARHGLWFAPDTSTSNRATLGGMIGNNSCGSRSARYGMTIDHVRDLDVVLADASTARFGPVTAEQVASRARGSSLEARLYRELPALVERHRQAIADHMPPFWRRAGGYRLDRLAQDGPFDLARFVVGSEGTLVTVTGATVELVPIPEAVVQLVGHFSSTQLAIAATADAMDAGAAGIELVDRFILDLARRSLEHAHLVRFLDGDPEALLVVEFYGDTPAEAEAAARALEATWRANGHGYAVLRAATSEQQGQVRALRKAGLGLLMASGVGRERSLAFVEDTAVDPRHLAEYTEQFAAILEAHGLRAGFYGHASAGCLHVRPFMDLTRPGEVDKLRTVAREVAELVTSFGGVNSSEHGDGLVRSEFNRELFGDELYGAMREVKGLFDPDQRMNPGKKVDAPPMTDHLREPALPVARPLPTAFDFGGGTGMFDAANRCMRIGACRKPATSGGTMCPSYMATRDEEHSTRGRANALVLALGSPDPRAALADDRLHEVLDLCLECKACQRECPLSVDMATMKSEALHARHAEHGIPVRSRVFAGIRRLNRLGSATAPLSNLPGRSRPVRRMLEQVVGIDQRRPLPRFERETLPRWFAGRARPTTPRTRGRVVLLADSFTSFTEPGIGRAAVELLERAGHQVRLESRGCCGRAAMSKGVLDQARAEVAALVERLAPDARRGIPIVGVEPSCLLTLKDDGPRLLGVDDPDVRAVAEQARLVEDLVVAAIDDGALELDADAEVAHRRILFHGHCHQKASVGTSASVALLQRIPGAQVVEVDAGCCGMAGSFGFETEHYDLSLEIGGMRLFPAVEAEPADTLVAATGVSCRQQIGHGTGRRGEHPLTLVRAALR